MRQDLDAQIRSAFFRRIQEKSFALKMGMKLVDVSLGWAIVEMTPGQEDTNFAGTIHGGVIFSLMDEAFQFSCNSHGRMAVALSMNITYHRPTMPGVRLRAESKEIHLSGKTGTYDIRVTDESERLIASCQALAYRTSDGLPFLPGGEKVAGGKEDR